MIGEPAPPPLPRPQPASAAARTLRDIAQAAASAWANAMDRARHNRAIRQLSSALRDIGLATWGLAYYQITDSVEPAPVAEHFLQQVTAASSAMLDAYQCLEDLLSPEPPTLPDNSDPGEALCQAARQTIRSWRRPAGTTAGRRQVIDHLRTATQALALSAEELSFQAEDPCGDRLATMSSHLSEAASRLTHALQAPAADPSLLPSIHEQGEVCGGTE